MTTESISPAQVLKAIRDGTAVTLDELTESLRVGRWFVPHSVLQRELRSAIERLTTAGLIREESGTMEATELMERVTRALKISLTELAELNTSSVIAHPLFQRATVPSSRSDVFVVMPFSVELQPVYDDHIKPVCSKLSLTAARADDFYSATAIVSDIWSGIYWSQVVIADCTGRNPNVFYEIAMAHTLGRPTILLSQNLEDVPFDLRYLRCLTYTFTPRGMSDFEIALHRMLQTELSNLTGKGQIPTIGLS